MSHFFLKVVPPRPTFGEDASADELAAMQRHFDYWLDLSKGGSALIFGPVMDAGGIYGMGVVEVADEAAAHAIAAADPAVAAGVVRITVSPMRVGAIRA